MTKFIKLHLKKPRIKREYKGSRFGVIEYQDGWCDDRKEVLFNVDNIESFSDYEVNDTDVWETADEILKELKK